MNSVPFPRHQGIAGESSGHLRPPSIVHEKKEILRTAAQEAASTATSEA
jgi:hypothetical protein